MSHDEILNNKTVQGKIFDDSGHEWNAAVVYEITLDQANQIKEFILNFNVNEYNMTTNNCTTFAVDALAAAEITLPTVEHNWTLPDRKTIIDNLPEVADLLEGGRAGIADKALNGTWIFAC